MNELIQYSPAEVYFFLTPLRLKLRNSRKEGLEFHRKTPTEGNPSHWPSHTWGQLSLFLQPTTNLLKFPVFELNNCFVFYRTWAVDIQSILEFL